MTLIVKNRVRETTTTTGTGNIALLGAVSDHRSFASAMSIGDTAWVTTLHPGSGEWETGLYTYSALNTLTRTTIYDSTNSNAAVNFSAGVKDVFLDLPASKLGSTEAQIDASITTAKIADLNVTIAKLETAAQQSIQSTGDAKLTLKDSADAGWVLMNDGTIGDASSSATARANADCSTLFALIWAKVSNTYASVSGGRGASAAADFAAHKTIALTKQLGRAIAIAGAGSGLTSRALGETAGAETVLLDATMIPAHSHTATVTDTHAHTVQRASVGATYSTPGGGGAFDTNSGVSTGGATSGSIAVANANTGGGGSHANVGPRGHWNIQIKL